MTPISRRTLWALMSASPLLLAGCGDPEQRARLRVFDFVRDLVDERYFSASALEGPWRSDRARYRSLAARAGSTAALYLDCLFPMLGALDFSHLILSPPNNTLTLSADQMFPMPTLRRGGPPLFFDSADEAGLGARLTWDGETLVADSVDPSGPAFAHGLRSGDFVRMVRWDGKPAGGRVILVVHSTKAVIDVTWTRGVPPTSFAVSPIGRDTVCVRFDKFDEKTVDWVLATLSGGPRQVILDLRTNRGGSIHDVWRLLSALLPPRTDIGTFVRRDNNRPTLTGDLTHLLIDRLAVLTGLRTSSGGEVMAAVLASSGRAVVVGDRTAGAVLAADYHPLPDGGTLMVPFADYLTPSGDRLEGHGVTPMVARHGPVPTDAFLAMAHRITTQ